MKTKKEPVIRRGQKVPYRKATNQEIEARIEYVTRLIAQQFTKTEIHKRIHKKYNLDWRTCDVYISRARKWLAKQSQMTSDEAKSVGVNVLVEVFRTGKPSERVSAERSWREIFGYTAPTKIVNTALPGEVVTISNPLPSLPQVHLYLPEGRRAMFKPADAKEPAPAPASPETSRP